MENRFRSNLTGDLPQQGGSKFNSKFIIVAVVALLVVGGGAYYMTKGGTSATNTTEETEVAAVSTNEEILSRLSKIYMTPEGEVPQVRTAGEVLANLSDKSVLAGAIDTDKLIIYNTAGKVIIFRPSTSQIVNILPLNAPKPEDSTGQASATGSSTPQVAGETTTGTTQSTPSENDPAPAANLTGEVRNGTTTSGAAGTLAKKLQTDLGLKSVKTGNAANTDYTKTVIVNLTGKNVSAVEKQLGITSVNELPAGEKPSTADFLVIIGK